MKRKKSAVGYVCPIRIPGTGEIIGVEEQMARIKKHVEKEDLTLLKIYVDEEPTGEVLARPGIKELLTSLQSFDLLLVERVWVLGRKKAALEPLLAELDSRGVTLEACSYLWDMVSQQVRHHYYEKLKERAKQAAAVKTMKEVA